MPRVGLVMVAVTDLSGSGGAERQFSDLFQYLRQKSIEPVTLITAAASLARLREAGRLSAAEHVVTLPLGPRPAQGRIGVAWMTLALLWVVFRQRFDVVHVCLPTPSYVPFAAILTHAPKWLRPRVVLSVIDCTVAHNLGSRLPADLYEQQVLSAHRLYFKWARLDGIFTWYRAFVEACTTHRLGPRNTLVRAARFCFTRPERFRPSVDKQDVIVFAGRFSEQKRPLLFVEAAAVLRARSPQLLRGWKFEMYGGGPLEPEVRARVRELGLSDIVLVDRTPDLAPVFARSKVFISTQALENFTSLSMLEAMAAGNAVIAEDVGQTREFVRDRCNGFLVPSGTPEAFADAIGRYLTCATNHDDMARESRRLATEVHTIDNFAADIRAFWRDVLDS